MYEINEMPEQLEPSLLEKLAQAETATIGHSEFLGIANSRIVSLLPGAGSVIGTAVTLALPALDSTLLHHCVGMLRPGDILVIDRLGDERYACLGGGVMHAIKQMQATAVIVDGPCADPHEMREIGLPVWGHGFSAITTRLCDVWGALNVPISCGGAVVNPGDAVLADENGVYFGRPDKVEAVAQQAIDMQNMEQQAWPMINREKPIGELSGASSLVRARLDADKEN